MTSCAVLTITKHLDSPTPGRDCQFWGSNTSFIEKSSDSFVSAISTISILGRYFWVHLWCILDLVYIRLLEIFCCILVFIFHYNYSSYQMRRFFWEKWVFDLFLCLLICLFLDLAITTGSAFFNLTFSANLLIFPVRNFIYFVIVFDHNFRKRFNQRIFFFSGSVSIFHLNFYVIYSLT